MYDCDPVKNPDALLHRLLSYGDVRTRKLGVMDETAITLCKENGVPVVVFNLMTPGNILRAVTGDTSVGTTVCDTLVSFARAGCSPHLLHVTTSGLATAPRFLREQFQNPLHLVLRQAQL